MHDLVFHRDYDTTVCEPLLSVVRIDDQIYLPQVFSLIPGDGTAPAGSVIHISTASNDW